MADDPEDLAKKFQPMARGRYMVIAVHDQTVKILKDGLKNLVNIDRVSLVPEDVPLPVLTGQKKVSADPEVGLHPHEVEVETEPDGCRDDMRTGEIGAEIDANCDLAEEYVIEK